MDSRRGFALAVALMILALLSVLGAAAVESLSIETRISAHDRDARVALYLAEAALGEARYYASRGWGKMRLVGSADVVVDTPLAPGLAWEADLYAGFTLYDRVGAPFTVVTHTDDAVPPVLTLAVTTRPPAEGRFTLVRLLPATATWSVPHLTVEDDPWAAASPPDAWRGWTVWNADGRAFPVLASSTAPVSVASGLAVRLTLPGDPGPGPYRMALNPWLRDLASGASLSGDAAPAAAGWTRAFSFAPQGDLGTAAVVAEPRGPDQFGLTATASVGASRRAVALRVTAPGLPEQQCRDWAVVAP